MRYGHRIAPGRRRPWRAGSWPGTRRPSHPSCACRWPRRGDRDAGRTASASPAGQRNPLRAAPGSECALKYNCPFPPDDLPWTYDDMADAETSRVPKPALAARGCPGRSRGWSGCGVSAKRHLPATAPGNALGAVLICAVPMCLGMSQRIGSRSPKPAKCGFNSCRPCEPLVQA